MDPIGIISILIFFGTLFGSIKGWIPQRVLPIQVALLAAAALIGILAFLSGKEIHASSFVSATTLHPITAVIAGFIFAGALKASGGFDAATDFVRRISRTPLGIPFAVVLLVNLPTIFAMPCGRIWVSPLMPIALMLGYEVAKERGNPTLPALVVFGLVVNAAASCGPSLIGGIGVLGEGMGRYGTGSFSNPQSIAIVVITVVTMALLRFVFAVAGPSEPDHGDDLPQRRAIPEHGYFSFILFVVGLAVTVVIQPPVPIQTILVFLTVVVMIIARLSVADLLDGILLHPLTAMISGFIVAGALVASGGFDVLLAGLDYLALHTPLGYIGVALLLIYLPIVFPMPCGRIIAVSLIPGVLMFGERLAAVLGRPPLQAVLLISFILSAAASCGPSPIGGIGCLGEGNMGLKGYVSGRPQALGIFLGVPVAALVVSFTGLSQSAFTVSFSVISICVSVLCGLATNVLLGFKVYHPGGILGGALVGALLIVF